jgi:flagellar hook-associated protein 3 FlgL
MRVTNSMLVGTLLRNLNNNMEKMTRSQEQLSSGKRINRPSDDPVGLVDSLRLRTSLTELEQYKSNAEDARSILETTDNTLNEAGSIIQRIRELTVQGATATMPQIALDAVAKEVSQLKEQLVQVGNTTIGGRYIFSGTETLTKAFDALGVFQGNTNSINYEVGIGITIPVNVDGSQAFGNLFTVLDDLINDLNTGNISNISNTRLGEIDTAMDQQLQVRADIGAKTNRIEFAVNRMESQNVNLTGLLSKTEDVDMAELITRFKMQENVYNASLSAGARIVQPTLMDFLR